MTAVSGLLLVILLSAIGSAVSQIVAVQSPDYPKIPPPGTKIIWYMTSDVNSNILLTCDDVRVAPSRNCKEGFFLVNDGEKEEKFCGPHYTLAIKSVKHQMKVEFYLNWTTGVANCLVEGVGLNVVRKDESTKPGTGEPGNGTGEPGDGTGEPGGGTGEPGDGTGEPGGGTGEPGDGTDEPGDGTGEPGNSTGEPGDGTGEPGNGTDEPGDGTGEPGGGTGEPGNGTGEPGDGTDGTGGTGDGTDEPGGGTGEPGDGSGKPGGGTGEPGDGSGKPGGGTGEPGNGTNEPGDGTDEPGTVDLVEHLVKLKLGGPAYDEIILQNIGSNQHFKWKFVTTPKAKITFFCRILSLGSSCSEGKIATTGGVYTSTFCRGGNNVLVDVSKTNTLGVEIRTYNLQKRGNLDCIAQAVPIRARVNPSKPHHFQHLRSREDHDDSDSKSTSDSKEHGKLKKTTCKCGFSKKNRGRIVNGKQVSKGEYPWVVALIEGNSQFCGGSIITEHHVLTAAHCTVGKQAGQISILTGTIDIRKVKKGQVIEVKKIIEHNYDRSKLHLNDISILYLKKKIKFSKEVGPICLSPKQISLNDESVTVMGWGSLGPNVGWNVPPIMMKAKQRVVDVNTCGFLWYRVFNMNRQDRVCSWAHDKTACFGDSGGPLVWLDPEIRRYTQIGIVSFGHGCGTAVPTVYTDVSFFFDWIQKVIDDTKKEKICMKKDKKRF